MFQIVKITLIKIIQVSYTKCYLLYQGRKLHKKYVTYETTSRIFEIQYIIKFIRILQILN